MLTKEILIILDELKTDIPEFEALESISPRLVTDIAYWINEDRIHHSKKVRKIGVFNNARTKISRTAR